MQTIHFAHANGFPSACYRKLFTALGDEYSIRHVSNFGHDPRFPVHDNWPDLIEQLRDSIERQCDGPVIAVGHSMGGILSFMAAHHYPELIREVIMLDSPILNWRDSTLLALGKRLGFIDRLTPAGRTLGRRSIWPSREEAASNLRHKSLFRDFDEDCFSDYLNLAMSESAEGVALDFDVATEIALYRTVPTAWRRYYKPLAIPVTLLYGEQSHVLKTGGFRGAFELASRHSYRTQALPGGHLFPLEHPLATAGAIKAVLEEHRQPAALAG